MRMLLLAVPLVILAGACARPPTPEELAEQTAADVDTFWQEAVSAARTTNTMQVRDELFNTVEGLQRYPSSSRPVIPDSSVSNDAFADFKVLTKRVFTQANVISSGGATITFRVTGTDLCTPLRGSFNADTVCVRNTDNLKLALRAVGGSKGVDLTLLVNDTIEVGTVQILKGLSISVTVDLANARAASEFFNSTLGRDSPFVDVTFDGSGKVEAKLLKYGPSDFEASISFLTEISGSVTDNNGFTRSGKSAARAPVFGLRVDGQQKNLTTSIDLGATEYRALWSDFFDYQLKSPMVWALSGFGYKAAFKDGGARTLSGVNLGPGPNTLSFAGQTVVSVTLNPNAGNHFDLDFSTGSSGLSAVTARPGISFAISFNLQPVANAGSNIDPKILSSTYAYDLSSNDQGPQFEFTRPTQTMDGAWTLNRGSLSLVSPGSGAARVFNAPTCMTFRRNYTTDMNPFLDLFMRCDECKAGECGGVYTGGQSLACKKYLACYEAVAGGGSSGLESTYGLNGSCWRSSPATAQSCTSSCSSGTVSLASSYPNLAECQ